MPDTQFKVMWRFPKAKKSTVMDYQCKDLATLLKMLERSEGVTQVTVEELCIHAVGSDGKVRELFATNKTATLPDQEETTTARDLVKTTLIGPVVAAKPRVKARPYVEDPSKVYAAMGLYNARVAPPKKEATNG